jgi:hypothetical protein
MGSPAGFLNFQGHNAINNAHQYISFNFSNNLNESLAFTDAWDDYVYEAVQSCDYKPIEPVIHNFTVEMSLFRSSRTAPATLARRPAMPTKASSTRNQMSLRDSTGSWWSESTDSWAWSLEPSPFIGDAPPKNRRSMSDFDRLMIFMRNYYHRRGIRLEIETLVRLARPLLLSFSFE